MNIGEILIGEATNVLLLIPVVIALVILTRWIRGKPSFYRLGLALSLRQYPGESSIGSPLA
jgi:hypothetical protein